LAALHSMRVRYLMRILLTILFIFIFCQKGISQSSNSAEFHDLDELYDAAWDLIVEFPDSCMKISYTLLAKAQKQQSHRHRAFAYSCIAEASVVKGNVREAIETHRLALDIYKQINDQQGMSATYGNMGNLYFLLNEYESAKKFMSRGYEIEYMVGDSIGMAYSLANLGIIEKHLENFDLALENYKKGLAYVLNDDEHIQLRANLLGNIGSLYITTAQHDLAYPYLIGSLDLKTKHSDELSLATVYNNLGEFYETKGDQSLALKYFNQAMEISERFQAIPELISTSFHLYRSHKKHGNIDLALKYFEKHYELRQERDKEENTRALARMEIDYEYTVKAAADSVRMVKEKELLDAEKRAVKQRSWWLGIAAILGLFFILIVVNRYRVVAQKNKIIGEQKLEVEKQRDLVEEKNKEIMDSITYARRIQNAILPAKQNLESVLPEYFVYYLPKDVVAGDFYWLEQHGDVVLIAAADCTGHGVPGAMVSVICNNGLNRSVREYGKTIPGEILDQTREIVLQEFEKSEDDVKDGMDISLVSLAHRAEEQNENESEDSGHSRSVIQWSGANNPLWIVRNSEIIEIKPDKQPIGKYDNPKPFTTHEIEVQQGDKIYLFTDGIQDQFGGEKGKKLKPSNFKKWLLEVENLSMNGQKTILAQKFEAWKSDHEQLDDVCLIGIEIV
jgi:serine phosphatase RsbU (regulator of sigma subunit)